LPCRSNTAATLPLHEWHLPAVMSRGTEALAARKRPHFMHNSSEIRPSSDNTATFMGTSLEVRENLTLWLGKGK
jgi:hypothetical protein